MKKLNQLISHLDVKGIRKALKRNPSLLNTPDDSGWSPIRVAADMSTPSDVVTALLEAGMEMDLLLAASFGDLAETCRLLSSGEDSNSPRAINGCTPLFYAAREGYLDIVKQLLASGADPAIKGDFMRTPLDKALEGGAFVIFVKPEAPKRDYLEIVGLLAAHSQDTSPAVAAAMGDVGTLEQLLAEGLDPDHVRETFWASRSLLHYAADFGQCLVVDLLLNSGADPNVPQMDWRTPLDLAIECGNSEVQELLRKHGGKRGGELGYPVS